MCNIANMGSNEFPNQFHWQWTNWKVVLDKFSSRKTCGNEGKLLECSKYTHPTQIRPLKQWLWYTNIVSRYVVRPLDWKRGSRFTYQYAPCFERRNWQPIVCTIRTTCVVGTIVPSTYLRNNWETTANACWHATGGTNGVTLLPRSIRIWDISCKRCNVRILFVQQISYEVRASCTGGKKQIVYAVKKHYMIIQLKWSVYLPPCSTYSCNATLNWNWTRWNAKKWKENAKNW